MMRQRFWRLSLVIPALLAGRTLVGVAQEQACVPPPPGLAGWWPGNGNANDVQYGNNGTIDNTVTFGEGKVGQGFVFGANTTGVKLPVSRGTNIGAGSGMTLECWINPTDASPGEPLFDWNNGQTFGVHLWIHEAVGELYGNFMDIGGVAHFIKSPPGVVTAGAYQHIALTYDRNTGVAVLYRNGQPVATETLGNFYPQTTFDLYLGYRPAGLGAGLRYKGSMDEVSLYRRALAASEIMRIYNAGAAGKCPPGAPGATGTVRPTAVTGTGGIGTTGTTGTTGIGTTGTTTTTGTTGTTGTGTTGTGTTGATTSTATVPTPTPVPQPTPTPVPITPRPNPAGPVAVLDFAVAPGLDPALGHQVSDALAAALQKSGMDVRTQQQVLAATPPTFAPTAARPRYRTPADIEAAQRQQAQAAGAGSVIFGKVTGFDMRKGQTAQLTIDVRQLEAATGTNMDGITVSENSTPRTGTVANQALWDEVLRKAVASVVRVLKPGGATKLMTATP